MRWAIPGLNTRETALVFWVGGALLLISLTKGDVRRSIGQLAWLIMSSVFLGGVLIAAAIYVAGLSFLLSWAGYWDSEMTRLAVIWFIGFGIAGMFNPNSTDRHYYLSLVLRYLGLAVAVEFVVNLHTFPLPVELVLVPVALLAAMTYVYAGSKPEYSSTRKPLRYLLNLIGIASLAFALVYVATHTDEVFTRDKVMEFLLPFELTLAFVPFLVLLRFVAVYQGMLAMVKFGLRERPDLYRYARRAIFRACGVNLGKAQLFESKFRGRLWGITSVGNVDGVVSDFSRAWAAGQRVHVEMPEELGELLAAD